MASRRKRCTGPCGELYPPERLARVAGRDWLCPDCLVAEATTLAPAETLLDEAPAAPLDDEGARDAPEPLELPDEDERFAGLIAYDVPGWPLRKGRLSASGLSTFLRCPEQFRRQYVHGEKRPSGGKGLAGTAAHATVEAALRHRMAGKGLASLEQVEATYHATFDAAIFKAYANEGIAWGRSEKKELDEDSTRDLGRRGLVAYYGSPSYERLAYATAVEHTFAFTIPGVAVPLCGLIDVLTPRSTVDLKFGDKCLSAIDPGWRVQALVYALAERRPADFHSISWAGKMNDPSTEPALRLEWDARQAIIAARLIRGVVSAILDSAARLGPHQPWLGNVTHTWACSSCEFRPECAWWNVPDSDLLLA